MRILIILVNANKYIINKLGLTLGKILLIYKKNTSKYKLFTSDKFKEIRDSYFFYLSYLCNVMQCEIINCLCMHRSQNFSKSGQRQKKKVHENAWCKKSFRSYFWSFLDFFKINMWKILEILFYYDVLILAHYTSLVISIG